MSGNICETNHLKSDLGGGISGTSTGAGSPLDRVLLRRGSGGISTLMIALGLTCQPADEQKKITPFREAYNAGDPLGTINSGPHPKLPQINQVNSLITVLTGSGQDGVKSGGAGFTGNQRWVYDSSDYTRFKNLSAKNKNYNDITSGGDDSNASQVALMRVRR